jgi:hypothetical protein
VSEQRPAVDPDSSDHPAKSTNRFFSKIKYSPAYAIVFCKATSTKARSFYAAIRKSGMRNFQSLGIFSILIFAALTIGPPWSDASIRLLPLYIFVIIGFLFGLALWRVPRERYSATFAGIFGWLPVTLGTLSYPFWYLYASRYPDEI